MDAITYAPRGRLEDLHSTWIVSIRCERILMRHITQLTTDNNCAQLDINCIRSQPRRSCIHPYIYLSIYPSIYLAIHPSSWLVFSLGSEIRDARCGNAAYIFSINQPRLGKINFCIVLVCAFVCFFSSAPEKRWAWSPDSDINSNAHSRPQTFNLFLVFIFISIFIYLFFFVFSFVDERSRKFDALVSFFGSVVQQVYEKWKCNCWQQDSKTFD